MSVLNGQILYEGKHNIVVRLEEKDRNRPDTVVLVQQAASETGRCNGCLNIQITDEKDLLFFYSISITESDFMKLKVEQGLLVDFYSFHKHLINMLEMCTASSSHSNRFILVLSKPKISAGKCYQTSLDIVEKNPFKELCHLSLPVVEATEDELKHYVCDKAKLWKEEYDSMREKLASVEQKLTKELEFLKDVLSERNAEINKLKQDLEHQTKEVELKCMRDVADEKEKVTQFQATLQKQWEIERQKLEEHYKLEMVRLESRVVVLDAENKDLLDTKYRNEAKYQELHSSYTSLKESFENVSSELELNRQRNAVLSEDNQNLCEKVRSQGSKISAIEHELEECIKVTKNQNAKISSLQKYVDVVDQQYKTMEDTLHRRETNIEDLVIQLFQANRTIYELKGELQEIQKKISLQEQLLEEQGKALVECKRSKEEISEKLIDVENKCGRLVSERDSLNLEIEKLKKKSEEDQENINSQQKTITFLKKHMVELSNKLDAVSYPTSTPLGPLVPPVGISPDLQSQGVSNINPVQISDLKLGEKTSVSTAGKKNVTAATGSTFGQEESKGHSSTSKPYRKIQSVYFPVIKKS